MFLGPEVNPSIRTSRQTLLRDSKIGMNNFFVCLFERWEGKGLKRKMIGILEYCMVLEDWERHWGL